MYESNFLGHRVFDHRINEAATIIDVQDIQDEVVMVILQYDDGEIWDETLAGAPFEEKMGWTPDGLLSENFELMGPGPLLQNACDEHDWFPSPDRLWNSYEDMEPDFYYKIVRCKKCGLSGHTTGNHGKGTFPPSLCASCDGATGEPTYSAIGYEELPVCPQCAEEIEEGSRD